MTSPPKYDGDLVFDLPASTSSQLPTSSTASPSDAAQVSIHLGAGPDSLDVITIDFPPNYSLLVPSHYHPKSTEWMKVLEGELHLVFNGQSKTMRGGDDWYEIPPMTVHSIEKKSDGKRAITLERCGPDAQAKKRFFQDILARDEGMPGLFGAMASFYRDGDIIPALPGAPYTNFVGWSMVNVVGRFAHMTGLDLGYDDRVKSKKQ